MESKTKIKWEKLKIKTQKLEKSEFLERKKYPMTHLIVKKSHNKAKRNADLVPIFHFYRNNN
jgi:uncharacterized protein YqgQ